MNRYLPLTVLAFAVTIGFISCYNKQYLEVDTKKLQEKIYEPTAVTYQQIDPSVTLYLDHSTCVIDANQNSPIFRALKGQLGLYTDTLCLIKGNNFEVIENTDKSPTSTTVFNIINEIEEDIPFANIGSAVKNICDGNSQAVLITDCEYFDENGRNQDGFPYLSGAFKNWLEKGHVIYVVTEPYQERNNGRLFDKKRFYFFFTDDKMLAPISHNLLNELQTSLQNELCFLFELTNSDLFVQRDGKMFSDNLDTSDVTENSNFKYAEILSDWNIIREYVMKLDKYGQLLTNDDGTGEANPVPLVQNLVFNEGKNYTITDVKVVATNITTQYLALEDSLITPNIIDMSEGFKLDKNALLNHKLNVFLTDKVFNYLTDEYGGNLIRLDFVVTKAGLQNYDTDMFSWQSLYNNEKAICVAKSIDNVLHDTNIVPMSKDRRVIHSVFIKTEAYN